MLESINLLLAYPTRSLTAPVDPVLQALEGHWRSTQLRVNHLPLLLTSAGGSTRSDAEHIENFHSVVRSLPYRPVLVVGGFSLGARIAALSLTTPGASPSPPPQGLLGLGFPFHTHGSPQHRPGFSSLQSIPIPTLIVQGTRDSHGTQQEVNGYPPLPGNVAVHWLPGAKHRFAPGEHTAQAAEATLRFLRQLLLSSQGEGSGDRPLAD